MKEIKKLVRDNIPNIIIADGRKPKIKIIKGHDLLLALNEKLVEEHEDKGKLNVHVNVSDLPDGTHSIQKPNGEVINIYDEETILFEIEKEDLDNGMIEITALEEKKTPISALTVLVASVDIFSTGSIWDTAGPILMWALIGILVLALAGVAFLKVRKIRA